MIAAAALALSIAAAPAPPPVRIEARDYSLTMPPRIPAGLTWFAFENHGTEPHEARFMRLVGGHTAADFDAWRTSGKPIPDWIEESGGIGTIAPGVTADYLEALPAGAYIVLCGYQSPDGTTHLEKGMAAPFQVEAGTSAAAPPDADITVSLHDHGFQLSAPVTKGRPLWHVKNGGTEAHQALLVRLPLMPNYEYDERAWFNNGSRGPRPGIPAGGVIEVDPGAEAWFRVDLPPGRYLLLCTMIEQDGRHFDLGMIYRFTIE